MQNLPYMALIFAAGLCWPMQAAVNAELKNKTGQPLIAVLVNGGGAAILAGLAVLILGLWLGKVTLPDGAAVRATPWWAYLGGVFSVLVIVAQSSSAVPLGAALLITLFVAGQGLASMVFDQFGLMGYTVKAISPARGAGVALLLAGAALLAFENRTPAPTPTPPTGAASAQTPPADEA